MTENLAGLPDEAALTRLANELFAAPPAAGAPATAATAATQATQATPAATVLSNIPDSLEESGITVHAQPRREAAAPGWDPMAFASVVPTGLGTGVGAGLGDKLSDPYAPLRAQEFYFAGPLQVNHPAAPVTRRPGQPSFDVAAIRRDFPILAEHVNGHQLVWLDNAATTQKPQEVIDRLVRFYTRENSNIHRAAHELAARATQAYEDARVITARFLGAPAAEDIVFARGTTEAINLVAQSWGRTYVGSGDEIVLSHLEHHANIVPWQLLAGERGATLRVMPVDDSGQVILDEYRKLLTPRTRLVAVSHVSNALGTVLPLREITAAAHDAGAAVLVDGAQAVSHMPVDVRELDADFYVFSGHKVFGPTGIGALYGKPDVLDSMPPWQGGGNMIRNVTFERTVYQPPPTRFEAGTASIADAVGLGAALEYVERVGRAAIASYEHDLLGYATQALEDVPGLHLVGTAPGKAGILSFVLDGYRPEEVGSALDCEGIAVRAGHHCAQPILRRFGLEATVRAALAMYNTYSEVDQLAAALHGLARQRARKG